MRLTKLIEMAQILPEPHRANALGDVSDAYRDLRSRPHLRQEILDDLERAIKHHQAMVEEHE